MSKIRLCICNRDHVNDDEHTPACQEHREAISTLTTSLARVTAERDELLRERDIAFHPEKHCMVPLAAMKELSDQRDALRASLAGAEKLLDDAAKHLPAANHFYDEYGHGEKEDAVDALLARIRSALTPPPTKEASGICSAHQTPSPSCHICYPKEAPDAR